MSCLYILEIKPFLVASFAFSLSRDSLFILLMDSFSVQKLLSLIRSHLFIFALFLLPWEAEPKKTLLQFMSENVFAYVLF